jgi:hypothetical protein
MQTRLSFPGLQVLLAFLTVAVSVLATLGLMAISSQGQSPITMFLVLGAFACSLVFIVLVKNKGEHWGGNRSVIFFALLLGIVIWGLFQLLHSVAIISEEWRSAGYSLKNYMGAATVIILSLWAINALITNRLSLTKTHLALLFLGQLFPLYAAISMTLRGYFNFPLISMYFLWALYVYLLLPIFLKNTQAWITLLRLIWFVVTASLAIGIYWGIAHESIYWLWTTRISFVFSLVQYGNALGILAVISLALFTYSKSKKFRLILAFTFVGALVLSVLAVTRGTIVFIIVTTTVFWIGKKRYGRVWLLALLVLVPLLAISFVEYLSVNVNDIDRWSSGRLSLFSLEISQHMSDKGSSQWLFGSDSFLGAERTLVVDQVGAEARMERNVTDNSFLAMILSHGIVGLILFAVPLFYSFYLLMAHEQQATREGKRYAQLSIATLIGLCAQSMFAMTIPSMGNMVSIYLPVLWLPVLFQQWPVNEIKARR